jgi:hypothetical protein
MSSGWEIDRNRFASHDTSGARLWLDDVAPQPSRLSVNGASS